MPESTRNLPGESSNSQRPKGAKKTAATERLRSLFNSDVEKKSFSLFDEQSSDRSERDDVDLDDQLPTELSASPTQMQSTVTVSAPTPVLDRALFFPHPESAFLDAQSQFSRAPSQLPMSREEFEKDFYANRGEWAQKARRRRRDAVRTNRRRGDDDKAGGHGHAKKDDDIVVDEDL